MVEVRREDISDKYSWWCRGCKTRKSVRHGSFFARSKLELEVDPDDVSLVKRMSSW